MEETKLRYSDEELEEFRQIILEKLEVTKRDYNVLMDQLTNRNDNGVDDTMPTYHTLEEGSEMLLAIFALLAILQAHAIYSPDAPDASFADL